MFIITGSKTRGNQTSWTDSRLRKAFGNIEDHEYVHFNRALGKKILSKEHFIQELSRGGYVGDDEGKQLAEEARKNNKKPYDGLSKNAEKVIRDLKASAGKDGKLSNLEGTKRACEKVGVRFDIKQLPSHYQPKGGGICGDEGMTKVK